MAERLERGRQVRIVEPLERDPALHLDEHQDVRVDLGEDPRGVRDQARRAAGCRRRIRRPICRPLLRAPAAEPAPYDAWDPLAAVALTDPSVLLQVTPMDVVVQLGEGQTAMGSLHFPLVDGIPEPLTTNAWR